jgi:hypothetical protein
MTIDTAAPMRAEIRRVLDAALAYADAALTYAIVRPPVATRRIPITVSCPNFTGFPQSRVSGQSGGNAPQLHPPGHHRLSKHGASTIRKAGTNRAHKNDPESYYPRPLRVRRQGLEPRFFLSCCQTMPARAGSCHSVRSPVSAARFGYRMLPARTGASEQT